MQDIYAPTSCGVAVGGRQAMQVPNSKFGLLVCDQKMQTRSRALLAPRTSAYPGLLPRVFSGCSDLISNRLISRFWIIGPSSRYMHHVQQWPGKTGVLQAGCGNDDSVVCMVPDNDASCVVAQSCTRVNCYRNFKWDVFLKLKLER
jgi:hypothetical protein